MVNETFGALLKYGQWAHTAIYTAANKLSSGQLDRPFDIGRGSLRKTLIHIAAGEHVWLQRCKGHAETKWPSEEEAVAIATLMEELHQTYEERNAFMQGVDGSSLGRQITYRDSFGSLFHASLQDMILQGILHSVHHRAQAVNIIRRLEEKPPEVDYMYWIRKPA